MEKGDVKMEFVAGSARPELGPPGVRAPASNSACEWSARWSFGKTSL